MKDGLISNIFCRRLCCDLEISHFLHHNWDWINKHWMGFTVKKMRPDPFCCIRWACRPLLQRGEKVSDDQRGVGLSQGLVEDPSHWGVQGDCDSRMGTTHPLTSKFLICKSSINGDTFQELCQITGGTQGLFPSWRKSVRSKAGWYPWQNHCWSTSASGLHPHWLHTPQLSHSTQNQLAVSLLLTTDNLGVPSKCCWNQLTTCFFISLNSFENKKSWSLIVGGCTTQYRGDYHHPLREFVSTNDNTGSSNRFETPFSCIFFLCSTALFVVLPNCPYPSLSALLVMSQTFRPVSTDYLRLLGGSPQKDSEKRTLI